MKENQEPAASGDRLPPIVESPAVQAMGRYFYDPPESETTLYRIPAMNVAFTITSLLLFLVTVWSIWQDHSRDWKVFQAEWRRAQESDYQASLQAENQRLQDPGQNPEKRSLADLETELRGYEAELAANQEYRRLQAEEAKADNAANMAEIAAKFHKSKLDSQRYYFEEARKRVLEGPLKDTPAGLEELRRLEAEFEHRWIKPYEDLQRDAEEKAQLLRAKREEMGKISASHDELKKKIAGLTRARDILMKNLRGVERNGVNAIRNAPILPPFAPSDQIQKVVLADLTEPLNFLDAPRVDRCKTCHVNIDSPDPSLAEYTAPGTPHGGKLFRSHPRLDLYVGSASPHPYEQVGCTICHYGDGHATSFLYAAHTPRDEEQEKEWEAKYGWQHLHHQDFPMLPMRYIGSTCAKCHPSQDRIDGAGAYNQGRELVEQYGCFGCHKIQGFEKYRKVGPNLRRIAEKTDLAFLYRWIKNPPSFRPTTRMPRFFGLMNSSGTFDILNSQGALEPHDFTVRNDVEALAIATFIEESSRSRGARDDLHRVPLESGDAARGKELARTAGCLGCHSIQAEGWLENDHGPDLSSVGSKLKPQWIADWIVHPRAHDPESRMPRLRLEEDEGGDQKIADLVAYLGTLKRPEFEAIAVPEIDDGRGKILAEISFDYLRRGSTRAEAQAALKAKSTRERLLYCGEKLVMRYGCFGCHAGISNDFDRATPIGTELSQHGSKEADKLDFAQWGHQASGDYAIPKNRAAWFSRKLDNPRLFDIMPKEVRLADGRIAYEPTQKVVQKSPEELLKMPLFSFRKVHDPADPEKLAAARAERVDQVVGFLLSRLNDKIPLHRQRRLGPDEEAVEKGRNLIRFLNCQGCHRVGADPKEIPLGELPTYSFDAPDDQKTFIEVERETWLAETITLGKMTIPAGTFLFTELKDENHPEAEETFPLRQIAARYWEESRTPRWERILKVCGFKEAGMRRYLGDSAEARPKSAPILRNEGERVNGDWFFQFLLHVFRLRIQLDLRMPSFNLSQDEASTIVQYFKLVARGPYPRLSVKPEQLPELRKWFELPEDVPFPPLALKTEKIRALNDWVVRRGRPAFPLEQFPEHRWTPEAKALAELGRDLFQDSFPGDPKKEMRLRCNTCHPAGSKLPTVEDKQAWGPDLEFARARLRPPWIGRWILDPKAHQPGTKMPDNFTSFDDPKEGVSINPGREKFSREVEAIVQYFMHLKELVSVPETAKGN